MNINRYKYNNNFIFIYIHDCKVNIIMYNYLDYTICNFNYDKVSTK